MFSIVGTIFWQEVGITAHETVAYVVAADSERYRLLYVMSRADFGEVRATQRSFGRQLLARVDLRSSGRQEEPVRTVSVVGVAEDTDTTHFMSRRAHTAYMPFAQQYYGYISIVARGRDDAAALAVLRMGIRSADPDLATHQIGGGRLVLAGPYVVLRTSAMVAAALGALTLVLAMVGLYGVQSHIVAHRTREIGVRMSFGATAQQIRRMVLLDGYRPVFQGLAIGLFIGFVGRALVRAFLVSRVDLFDTWMLTIVPAPSCSPRSAHVTGLRAARPAWTRTSHSVTCSPIASTMWSSSGVPPEKRCPRRRPAPNGPPWRFS